MWPNPVYHPFKSMTFYQNTDLFVCVGIHASMAELSSLEFTVWIFREIFPVHDIDQNTHPRYEGSGVIWGGSKGEAMPELRLKRQELTIQG